MFYVPVVMSLPRIFDDAPVAYLTLQSWCTAESAVMVTAYKKKLCMAIRVLLFSGFTYNAQTTSFSLQKSKVFDVIQRQSVTDVCDVGHCCVQVCQQSGARLTSEGVLGGQRAADKTHAVGNGDACVHIRSVLGDLLGQCKQT